MEAARDAPLPPCGGDVSAADRGGYSCTPFTPLCRHSATSPPQGGRGETAFPPLARGGAERSEAEGRIGAINPTCPHSPHNGGKSPYPRFTFSMSPPAQASTLGFITENHSGGMAASTKEPG